MNIIPSNGLIRVVFGRMSSLNATFTSATTRSSLSPDASTANADHTESNTTWMAIVISLSTVVVILIGVIVWLRRKKIRSNLGCGSAEDGANSGDKTRDASDPESTPFDINKNDISSPERYAPYAGNPEEIAQVVSDKELSPLDLKNDEVLRCEREQSIGTNESETCESDLYRLFKMLIDVLGTFGCVKLFINLDPDGNLGDIVTRCTPENCFQFFIDWTSRYSNIKHGQVLLKTLSQIGYKLPPDNQFYDIDDSNTDDGVMISKLLVSLTKARLLNEELREFCLRIAGRLGVTQMWQISESLHLRAEMEYKVRGGSHDAAFADTLVEWGLCSPYPHREGSERDKLMLLKSSMVETCGCDAIVIFDETAGGLLEILGNYYSTPQDQS
ncbi:hypothetical protein Btru_066983 [Bulinus truncatus]|nr:hypothetical protein Btru_066983 [Bulinus truncatus]